MQDNFSIRTWKNEKLYKEEYDAAAAKVQEQEEDLEADDIELEIPGDESSATVDKAMQAKASKQDTVIQAYKDINAKMQDALKRYKEAEGDAKEAAKKELKMLTPDFQSARKKYEKLKGVKL